MKIESQIAKKVIILAMNLHSARYGECDSAVGAPSMDWYGGDAHKSGEEIRKDNITYAIGVLIKMEIFDEESRDWTDDIVALSEMDKWELIK